MADDLDFEAYKERVKAQAEAARQAGMQSELDDDIAKRVQADPMSFYHENPVYGWTRKLPANIAKGTYRAMLETAKTYDALTRAATGYNDSPVLQELLHPSVLEKYKQKPAGEGDNAPQQPELPKGLQEPVEMPQTMFPAFFKAADEFGDKLEENNTLPDYITQGIVQFTIPFSGYLRALGGLKNATRAQQILRAYAAEGAAAGSAFGPHDGRLADLIDMGRHMENKFGQLLNKITPDGSLLNSYINTMTDRENEGEWEGRFKNIVDSWVGTAAMGGLIKASHLSLRVAKQALRDMAVTSGSPRLQRGAIDFKSPADLTDIERAQALKNTVVNEVKGEHIVLEGDQLNKNADIVPIKKEKK